MSRSVGDSVWLSTTHVAFDGQSRAHIIPATVAGVFDGVVMVKMPSGTVTAASSGVDSLCDSEAEAWACAARELSEARDRVQAAIDNAVSKAASSRVGEAVAS
jgi:hypothetical protein